MHPSSLSPAGDVLDPERVRYFRTVTHYAELVSRGGNLRFLVDGSEFVLDPELARIVPAVSRTRPVLTVTEWEEFGRRLGADGPLSVRALLACSLARHCLMHDVIHCVAKYHDEEVALFWLVQMAA